MTEIKSTVKHAEALDKKIGVALFSPSLGGEQMALRRTALQSWIRYVEFTATCWLWTGSKTDRGYPSFGARKESPTLSSRAHRFSYEMFVGPIPDDMELDHLCRVRHCVNPFHLEIVNHRENVLRGTSPLAVNAAKDRCIRGHWLVEGNIYHRKSGGLRACRQCHLDSGKARKEKIHAQRSRAI